jgi:hypothetical protein
LLMADADDIAFKQWLDSKGLGKFIQIEQVFIASAAPRIAFLTGSHCITKARQLTARCRHALTSLCKLSSHTSSMQC